MIFPNSRYEIYVADNLGNLIAPFNVVDFNLFVELSVTRAVGEIGACYIRLSGGSNALSVLSFMSRLGILRKDAMLIIYRTIGNQRTLLLDTVWFIRTIEQYREATGSFVIKITAYDTNYLLASRLTSNQLGGNPLTAFTNITVSQIMYQLVRDNMGTAASTRQMPNFFEGQPLANYGYLINHYNEDGAPFAYVNLLTALQELSRMTVTPVEVNETLFPVFFDTVAVDTNSYSFQLFANQRGADRRFVNGSQRAMIINDAMGQLQDVRFIADWQEEKTAVVGVWESFENNVQSISSKTVIDKTRIVNSPFSYREVLFSSPTAAVEAEATKFLRDPINYPTYSVYATLQDAPGFLYGIDWGYGDFVTLNAFGTMVDARINAISFNITSKSEQIQTQLQVSEAYTQ